MKAVQPRFQWLPILILLLGMVVFLLLCYYLRFAQDDAFISFRYAANFLDGKGLVYNVGERVEGYTNFLWVIALAASKWLLGIDFITTARVLSLAAGIILLFLIYSLVSQFYEKNRSLILGGVLFLLLANLSVPYWAVSGLETMAFTALVFASLAAEYKWPQFTAAILVTATLVRPEGALVFGIILLNRLLGNRQHIYRFILYYIAPLVPFAGFKLLYYGSLFPNAYYAKSGVGVEYIQSGLEYFWYFTRTLGVYGLIFIPPILAFRRLWRQYSLLYLFIMIYILYVIWVGGDVLKVYRFFVPVAPVICFLFVISLWELAQTEFIQKKLKSTLRNLAVGAVCLATAAGAFLLSWGHIDSYLGLEKLFGEKMHFTAGMLKKHMKPDFSIAASTIGMLGYELPGHRVIDMLGLTDSFIAHNPEKISGLKSTWKERRFNSRYLLEQNPDFILFSTNDKPSAPAELALVLHSEFRRCYNPTGFPRDTTGRWALVYMKWYDVNIGNDIVCNDIDFALNLKDGYDNRSKGKLDQTFKSFQAAGLVLKEDYPYLTFLIGQTLFNMGDSDQAMECFQYAFEKEPYNWHARHMWATIAKRRGDTAAANFQWREIRKISPWIFDARH